MTDSLVSAREIEEGEGEPSIGVRWATACAELSGISNSSHMRRDPLADDSLKEKAEQARALREGGRAGDIEGGKRRE